MQPLLARCLVTVIALCAVVPIAAAQRPVSFGIASTLPGRAGDGRQATVALELGTRRVPVRFRADFSAVDRFGEPLTFFGGAHVLVPMLARPFTPYFVGGASFGLDRALGVSLGNTGGFRVGGGLRYQLDGRILYLEAARHYADAGGSRLLVGVQF